MGRLAWHGPSVSTSRSAVRGLWEAHDRPLQIRFRGLARSNGVCCEYVQGASGRGEDRFGVTIRGRNGPHPRRTFSLTEILPRLQRFDGATD